MPHNRHGSSVAVSNALRTLLTGGVVGAIPDLRAVGSALLRPRLRVVESFGGVGRRARSTVVHGSATAHAAAASSHHRLAHEWSNMDACLRSRPRTGQCSG